MKSTGTTRIWRCILTAGGALTVRLHQLGASKGDRGPLQTDGKHHNYGDKPALHRSNSNTVGCLSVRVSVMRVRIVRMCVLKRLVNMLMRMRFLALPVVGMLVAVVRIVDVRMLVLKRGVNVLMRMAFLKVQPQASAHE
jgi:hypothetical protein